MELFDINKKVFSKTGWDEVSNNDKKKNSFGYYDEMFDKFLEHYFDGFEGIKENLIANYNTISKYSNQFKKIKDKKSAIANLPL